MLEPPIRKRRGELARARRELGMAQAALRRTMAGRCGYSRALRSTMWPNDSIALEVPLFGPGCIFVGPLEL